MHQSDNRKKIWKIPGDMEYDEGPIGSRGKAPLGWAKARPGHVDFFTWKRFICIHDNYYTIIWRSLNKSVAADFYENSKVSVAKGSV